MCISLSHLTGSLSTPLTASDLAAGGVSYPTLSQMGRISTRRMRSSASSPLRLAQSGLTGQGVGLPADASTDAKAVNPRNVCVSHAA